MPTTYGIAGWSDVKVAGAIGDGNASHAAANVIAINTALGSIPSTGGVLYFPPGTYCINAQLNALPANVRVVGCGCEVSVILSSATAANIFIAESVKGIGFDSIGLSYSSVATAGAAIYLQDVTEVRNYRCRN